LRLQTHEDGAISAQHEPVAGLRRIALITAIFAGNACMALLYDALPPILVPLSNHFGGGSEGAMVAQLATSLPLFGVTIAGLVAGLLIERFGIRPVMLVMLILFALAGSAGLALDNVPLFLLARILVGLAVGLTATCCTSLIAAHFTGRAQARMNSALVAMGALFAVGFIIVSGYLAAWSWRAPFVLHAATALVFLLPVLLFPATPQPRVQHDRRSGNWRRLAPLLPYYATAFAMFVMTLMFNAKLAFILQEAGISSPITVSRIFAGNPIGAVIGSALYEPVARRLGPTGTLKASFLLNVAALVLAGWTSDPIAFGAATIISGTVNGLGLSALWTAVMRTAPTELMPRALGLMTTALYLGGAMSPVILLPLGLLLSSRGQYDAIAVATLVVLAMLALRARAAPSIGPAD
jgi:MFS family permease